MYRRGERIKTRMMPPVLKGTNILGEVGVYKIESCRYVWRREKNVNSSTQI